ALAVAERQLIKDRRHKAMTHVEDRQSPLALEAEAVLREQRVPTERADAASAVYGLGQRVADEQRQPFVEPACELDGQRVVPSLRDVSDFLNFRVLRIRLTALNRACEARNRLVPVEHALQTIAVGPKVTHFERC